MTYDEELAGLAGLVGGRNQRLLGIALRGRVAGRDAETMVAEIVAASGTPPLSEAEVRRAVTKAMQLPIQQKRIFAQSKSTQNHANHAKHKKWHEKKRIFAQSKSTLASQSTLASSYSFVREMIEAGGGEASSGELIALSKVPVPELPWVQSVHFLMMLEEHDSGLFFTGTPRTKRTREHLKDLNALEVDIIDNPENLPTHILPNDLTGEPVLNDKGEESYAREECVRHARHTVIEFDEMPLKEQAAFWKGVILSDVLPLRALVYSGGKSIHGLLRLDETKDFKEQWKILEHSLASDTDTRYRCDLAFRSPVQMMRFPGALRPETNRRQALLYLGT